VPEPSAPPPGDKPVEGAKAERDRIDRGPAQKTAPQASARGAALPDQNPEGGDVGEGEAAFSLLSSQVGDVPADARLAGRYEIDGQHLEGAGLATSGMSREEIAATNDLLGLMSEGLLELPPALERAVRDRALLMQEPVSKAHVDALISRLTQSQRDGFADLAKALGPVFAGLTRGKAGERARLQKLRAGGKKRIGAGQSLQHIEPPELRELLEEMLGKRVHGVGDEETGEHERDTETVDEKKAALKQALLEPELRSISKDMEITLPPLDVVALEATFAASWPRLQALGEDELAELLMMHCAAANEGEMGELIEKGRMLASEQEKLQQRLERDPKDKIAEAALTAIRSQSDALAFELEFYLARRECFTRMVHAILRTTAKGLS
jgi:hypothetical protein